VNQTFVPEGVRVLAVSDLTGEIKAALEGDFASVWVAGEVSNLARPASGHLYLSLKDAQSSLRAVVYRGVALRLRFEPRDGQEVVARGRLSVYAPRGEYQLLVEELHPKGLGAAELALRQLKEKLFSLGFFDLARKRRLPRFPRRIGIITSPTGAAVRDLLEILGRRWPPAEVAVFPGRGQGVVAAETIAAALRRASRLHAEGTMPFDLVIVGRGGGSAEDLDAFNDEDVARAIFASAVPVVSAVGHEIDTTVADLVADVRAATPSHAAELATPDGPEILAGLGALGERFAEALRRRLELARRRLDELAGRAALRRPLERVRLLERQLDDWSERLRRAASRRLEASGERLTALASRLETLSPLNVLARGYSLTRTDPGGEVVREASAVRPGDRLRTTLAGGEVISRVEEVRG
jgi:exodeoxyribonuclease VII large subunit